MSTIRLVPCPQCGAATGNPTRACVRCGAPPADPRGTTLPLTVRLRVAQWRQTARWLVAEVRGSNQQARGMNRGD